jgi:hypothetical protein
VDPISIAVLGMAAVGGLLKGITGFAAGNAKKRQAEIAAAQSRSEAGVKAQVELENADETGAVAATRAAANGGGLDGSSADVLADLERKGMFNARSVLWQGETEAENALFKGRLAKKQGTLALISGTLDAGTTLLGGVMKSRAGASASAGAEDPPY